jgi:hypothetical protein
MVILRTRRCVVGSSHTGAGAGVCTGPARSVTAIMVLHDPCQHVRLPEKNLAILRVLVDRLVDAHGEEVRRELFGVRVCHDDSPFHRVFQLAHVAGELVPHQKI